MAGWCGDFKVAGRGSEKYNFSFLAFPLQYRKINQKEVGGEWGQGGPSVLPVADSSLFLLTYHSLQCLACHQCSVYDPHESFMKELHPVQQA